MTAVTRTVPVRRRPLLHAVLLLAALLLGVGLAVEPWTTALTAIGLGLLSLVALRPAAGAALLIVTSLLMAGIDRGVLIPLLRPQEAVLGLVIVGLAVSVLAGIVTGRPRLVLRFDRMDLVIVLMAIAASALPLAVMVYRGSPDMELDDLLYALQVWKLYAVFVVVRAGVRTVDEVRRLLWIAMGAAAIVGLLGVLQSLQLLGVQELMTAYFKPLDEEAETFDLDRATSTVGSPFSVGDIMIFSMAIAAGFLVRGHDKRFLLAGLTAFFMFCAVSSGQFSIAIGLVVAVVAFGVIAQRLSKAIGGLLIVALLAGVALQPVIENRLRSFDNSAGIPLSWQGRVKNLEDFFLPVLEEDNRWMLGVRPAARVPAPEDWRKYVYIEAGYLWLVWTGGVPLLVAYLLFVALALKRTGRVSRTRDDAYGVAGAAAFTVVAVIAILMILDIHLTLRGAGELSFTLLALGLGPPRGSE